MTITINETTKRAVEEAIQRDIPYIAAFIENGVATTYSSGTQNKEILATVSHLLVQIVLHAFDEEGPSEDGTPKDYEGMLAFVLEFVGEHAINLLTNVLSFTDTAN